MLRLGNTILVCLAALSWPAVAQVPEFGVETPSGGWYTYTAASVNDSLVTASITNSGNIWTLDLVANTNIKTVVFPWESQRHPIDGDITDDVFYYPHLAGVAEKVTNRNIDFAWWGLTYPGQIFAPLVITGDADNGRIIAATNWPAKKVRPFYAAERVHLEYENVDLVANDTATYSVLIDQVTADTTQGEKAWRKALDLYRSWLSIHVPPVSYPPALQNTNGYIYIGLIDWPEYNLADISGVWSQWRDRLPWMQFWGQMSNYAGPPALAVPPLLPGEQTGCCLYDVHDIHPRYLPSLLDFVQDSIVGLGYTGGYYSVPYFGDLPNDPRLLLDTDTGRTWLFDWLDQNENQYHANAFYIDVLGREYWGVPDSILVLFDGVRIPPMTIIEGMVDIYPAAGLLSGSLYGGYTFMGGPGMTPENSTSTTFPNMQRYLLNDRAVFMGPSNSDDIFMGPANDYWLERQTFILGSKFESSHPNDNWDPNTPSPALTMAILLRDSANWWPREPRYMDTEGITNIPSGIEVRRFVDANGCDLFAIDNWDQISGTSFSFQGQNHAIPSDRLSIIDGCNAMSIVEVRPGPAVVPYPNPFSVNTVLRFGEPLINASFTLYDCVGQVVQRAHGLSGDRIMVHRKELPAGTYNAHITERNKQAITVSLVVINE